MKSFVFDKWYLGNFIPNCINSNILNFLFQNNLLDKELHILSFELEKNFSNLHSIWYSNLGLKTILLEQKQYNSELTDWIYPIEPWGHLMYSLNVEAKDEYQNFFDRIPTKIIEDVNNDKGKIVINYSHEGWVSDWLLKGFYLGAKNKNIKFENIILILNDFNLENKLKTFLEKYDITKYPKVINYSFFLTASSKHFFEKHFNNNLELKHNTHKNNKFLFLNRRLDLHRVKLMCEIFDTIHNNSIISFDKKLITNEVKNFLINNNLSEKFDNLPQKVIADREDIQNTNGYQHENEFLYLDSYISIVTETSFYNDNDFISEKIWKPMYQFHPIIVVGRPHLLKYLKDIGFKTFNWLINEDYDNIEDNDKRMEFIIYEIKRLNKYSLKDIHEIIQNNFDDLLHNYNLMNFFGKNIHKIESKLLKHFDITNLQYTDIYKEIKLDYDEKII